MGTPPRPLRQPPRPHLQTHHLRIRRLRSRRPFLITIKTNNAVTAAMPNQIKARSNSMRTAMPVSSETCTSQKSVVLRVLGSPVLIRFRRWPYLGAWWLQEETLPLIACPQTSDAAVMPAACKYIKCSPLFCTESVSAEPAACMVTCIRGLIFARGLLFTPSGASFIIPRVSTSHTSSYRV